MAIISNIDTELEEPQLAVQQGAAVRWGAANARRNDETAGEPRALVRGFPGPCIDSWPFGQNKALVRLPGSLY